jgi:hypothetical protein
MKQVVAHIFPGITLRPQAVNLLFNSLGPPRILQLILWSCAAYGKVMQKQLDGEPQTPPDAPQDSDKPILFAKVNLTDIRFFLDKGGSEEFSHVFKHAARHLEISHLFKSFKDLLTYGHLPYCYAVTGVSLELHEKLGKMTLNEWVTKGLLCVTADKADRGKFFVEMPFMMLYHIYHSKEGIRHPILRLIKTPTLQLSSEDAEHLDLNTVLSRLYAASVVGKKEVSLKWLIPVAGVADISLSIPVSEVAALELKEIKNGGKKVTGQNIASVIEELESKSPQQVYAFVYHLIPLKFDVTNFFYNCRSYIKT